MTPEEWNEADKQFVNKLLGENSDLANRLDAICLNCGEIQHDQIDGICVTCQRAKLRSLTDLRDALAAEREAHEGASLMAEDACRAEQVVIRKLRERDEGCLQLNDTIRHLQAQLAAERQKVANMHNLLRNLAREEKELEAQLAAERGISAELSEQVHTAKLNLEGQQTQNEGYRLDNLRLRDQQRILVDALRPFAPLASEIPNNRKQLGILTQEDFIRAAAALAKVKEGK